METMLLDGAKDDKERTRLELELNRPPVTAKKPRSRPMPARMSSAQARRLATEIATEDATLGR